MAVGTPTYLGEYASTGNTTTGTVTLSAGADIGDTLVIAAAGGGAGVTFGTPSDDSGNTWTLVGSESTTGTASTAGLFVCHVTTALSMSDEVTLTRTSSGGLAFHVLKVTGCEGFDDVRAAFSDTNSTNAATSALVTDDDSLVIAAVSCAAGSNSDGGSGFTLSRSTVSSGTGNPRQVASGYQATPTGTTVTPAMDLSGGSATGWAIVAIELTATPVEQPIPASPTLVGEYASTGNTTTGTIALTAGIDEGDTLIVSAAAGAAGVTFSSIVDDGDNTWSLVATEDTTGTPSTVGMWVCHVQNSLAVGDEITVTRDSSGGLALRALAVSGFVDHEDSVAGFSDTNGSTATTSSITSGAGSIVVGAVSIAAGSNFAAGSGYISTGSTIASGSGNPRQVGTIHRVVDTAGSVTPTFDISGGSATSWAAVAVELIPAVVPDPVRRTTVAWIGDSNGFRDGPPPFESREDITRDRIETAGWKPEAIYWHCRGGKSINRPDSSSTTTVQNLTAADTELDGVDVAIIGLGTNDVSRTDQQIIDDINDVMDHCDLLNVRVVIWRGIAYRASSNSNSTRLNPIIKSTVEARGGIYADWHAYIHGPTDLDDWLVDDGSHMTEQGYVKYDAFGIQQLLAVSFVPGVFVKHEGAWVPAIPHVRVDGQWVSANAVPA